MHFTKPLTFLLSLTTALTVPSSDPDHSNALSIREPSPRGGGGGRGGGGISSGGSSGGGRGSSGGSSGGRPAGTSPSSNVGGTSARGSGVSPAYGGRYAGGGATPYAAGRASPRAGLAGGLLVGGALGFWILAAPYGWPNGAYRYTYPADISYYNETSMMNETVAGQCLCKRYQGCSCDAPVGNGSTYAEALIGDGSYATQMQNRGLWQTSEIDG